MFNPEKEVPSLELCKRLKEVGYPQEGGGWYWWRLKRNKKTENWQLGYFGGQTPEEVFEDVEYIKAPTCRELGEWMPERLSIRNYSPYHLTAAGKDEEFGWGIYYRLHSLTSVVWNRGCILDGSVHHDTSISNAYAKMLIWLIENGYVKFKENEMS